MPSAGRALASAGLVLAALLVPGAGCGGTGTSPADPEPFVAAVHDYLDTHHMDLRVAAVKSLTVTGDRATAEMAMEHADGMVGVKVRWRFEFTRTDRGWTVTRHEQ